MTESSAATQQNANKEKSKPADPRIYYAMALDPIHVGTGGYRLGRVDNTIVREPGTNLPKLPGTSLSGACRAYTAMATGKYEWTENGNTYCCAGQGQEEEGNPKKSGHCCKGTCPVCVSFGYAKKTTGFQGLAQFSDVRILFFPVHSFAGPVWITCPAVLNDAEAGEFIVDDKKVKIPSDLIKSNNSNEQPVKNLNLGWLMLDIESRDFSLNDKFKKIPSEITQHSVLVSNKLFSQIVNDNLEVRTSVSIDPETGAAKDGALFTYEAIPRSAVFWFNISYLDPKYFKIKVEYEENGEKKTKLKTPAPKHNGSPITVQETVEKGLQLFEHLGIGGMNTRGMGRLRVLNLNGTPNNTGGGE